MRTRVVVIAAAVFVLGMGTSALAQSGGADSGQNTTAGGSSASSGNQESSVSIRITGPGSAGAVQGAVAGGGSASGSSSVGSGAGSSSSSSGGDAGAGQTAGASAVDGGVVSSGFELPALELESQPAARSGAPLLTWVGVALIVVGFTVLYLRLPHGRSA